ncbi:hypothetical protein CA951_02560 [Rhodococcus sp. NCIMB 12038]|nr:hypothetical protein CA951_02560 [Rhodococcus sp. NCIMB 12038]
MHRVNGHPTESASAMPDHLVRQVLEPDQIDCCGLHLVRSDFVESERQDLDTRFESRATDFCDPLNLLVFPGG